MNWPDIKQIGYNKLVPIYGEIESNAMLRILYEDLLEKPSTINEEKSKIFDDAIFRLLRYEPIQYITGITYFMGLKLIVNDSVLIPRFETEELAALSIKKIGTGKLKVLDLGTGSGCISLAIKKYCPYAEVWSVDKSVKALKVAELNAQSHDLKLHFIQSDFLNHPSWNQLPHDLDLIVSNPPYIGDDEKTKMDKSTLLYEPHMALFAGVDPLIFYKKIAEFGKKGLNPMGRILVEINEFQLQQTEFIFESMGYDDIEVIKDSNGKDRIIFCHIK